ncbi:SpdD protein [Streptomyces sp. NPDC091383]|uniref:SpdD protein n=1 Tax=Streptomyces sp. NPDC091383 TaxID=3365996 RepID=UPI003819E3E5
MFTPKYPPNDTAPTPTVIQPQPLTPAPAQTHVPVPVAPPAPAANRPTIQLTPGSTLALVAGGGATVLVVGTVLVSMLLAVAVTGVSVAVVAIVLRLLVKDLHRER